MDPKLRKWVYIGSAFVLVILLVVIIRWRRSLSKYTYTDIQTGTSPPETTTYSNIIACQTAYNSANLTATAVTRPGFMTIFTNCVRSNVSIYVDRKCSWISTDPTGDKPEYAAFQTFTVDTNAIKTAYMDITTRATDSSSFSPSLEIVNAALKADLTGATRKYLAAVCPNYFKTPTGVTDPTTVYSNWRVVTGSTAPNTYSFYAGPNNTITASDVLTWAATAARYTVSDVTNEFTVDTPYVNTNSTYNNNSTFTNPDGTFIKVWEIARDNGPGTKNPQP